MAKKTNHKIIIGDSRRMAELEDDSVDLVVTSPPYWQLKDYGPGEQIGFHDTYQEYIDSLNTVWDECIRTLRPGCRLCINIGDQFARAVFYGRYKVIPIRTEIIRHCEASSLDYMGAIIWQKVTTCQTTGGATVMGSYPYPRGGIIKIDYEFILLFKKLGTPPRVSREIKEKSKLSKEEWNRFFNGHWNFAGEKQNGHIAMFPLELPRRLIKMFSFEEDTVLDPFAGSGTTTKAAIETGRNSTGYEINGDFLGIIKSKIGLKEEPGLFEKDFECEIIHQKNTGRIPSKSTADRPRAANHLERKVNPKHFNFGTAVDMNGKRKRQETCRVAALPEPDELLLDSGQKVKLMGLTVPAEKNIREKALSFLGELISKNKVILRFDGDKFDEAGNLLAYVYLENRAFVNAKLLVNGFARCNRKIDFSLKARFLEYEKQAKNSAAGIWQDKEGKHA